MTFQPSIPQATDLISVSQLDLLNNFTSLNSAWNVNHVGFNASGAGKHNFVSFPSQASDPSTAAGEVASYSKAVSAVSTLFLRKENNGTVIQISGQDPTVASSGSTFLPGGVIFKWGNTGAVSDNSLVSFASSFPTACWGVVLTIIDPNATTKTINVKTGTLSTTQFAVRVSTGSISAFYTAIGN